MSKITGNPSANDQWASVPGILDSMLKAMVIDESDPGKSVVGTIQTECARCAAIPEYCKEVDWHQLAEAALESSNSFGAIAAANAALAMLGYSRSPETYFWTTLAAQAIMDAARVIPEAAQGVSLQGAFVACFNLTRTTMPSGTEPKVAD